jgi:hypothetical protein
MKELVYSVKMVTRDALLGRIVYAADSFTMPAEVCNEQLAQFTTERQRRRRVHFRKRAFKHR